RICQSKARPIRTMYSMARSFGTGSEPGSPRQTGRKSVFGGAPNSLRQPQNIFARVDSSTWHSRPRTVSKSSPMRVVSLAAPGPILEPMTRTAGPSTSRANPPLVWVALGAVYIVWGTTYFAIRLVNQTMPPLLSASVRFLVAGTVMFAWTIRRGDRIGDRPGPRPWRAPAVVGSARSEGR